MIHKPKHPGLMVKSLCIDPLGLSVTEAAQYLKVARSTLSKLLNGRMSISPDMAVRLSIVFKTDAEVWVNLQAQYDLYLAEKNRKALHLKPAKELRKAA